MKYRKIPKLDIDVGVVGLGCEHIDGKPYDDVARTVHAAMDSGMNILDVFMPGDEVRGHIGRAIAGRRESVLIQGMIGSTDTNQQYDISRDMGECKRYFEALMKSLNTDYIDFGMLFFVDTEADYLKIFEEGKLLKYAQDLKRDGVIRGIGASSHNPVIARRMVETGELDILMFSVNPAFDLMPQDTDIETMLSDEVFGSVFGDMLPTAGVVTESSSNLASAMSVDVSSASSTTPGDVSPPANAVSSSVHGVQPSSVASGDVSPPANAVSSSVHGVQPARAALYQACEREGVAVTTMKTFGAGKLLSAEHTPFALPMTPGQCISYVLDRPAVVSALVGCASPDEVATAMRYFEATAEELSYSEIISGTHENFKGSCVYCNHCRPCPAEIDIAAVTRYLDIALLDTANIPPSIVQHYDSLAAHGGDCIGCGSCEERCPFSVQIIGNMNKAAEIFGK